MFNFPLFCLQRLKNIDIEQEKKTVQNAKLKTARNHSKNSRTKGVANAEHDKHKVFSFLHGFLPLTRKEILEIKQKKIALVASIKRMAPEDIDANNDFEERRKICTVESQGINSSRINRTRRKASIDFFNSIQLQTTMQTTNQRALPPKNYHQS